MAELLAHRGPDGAGGWVHPHGHVGMAHRRLAIFDPSPWGAQPMGNRAGDRITYNGEVYNHPELRTELGGRWHTRTDTEVVLRAHQRWGNQAVERLRGMFAYALWQERTGRLLLVRDRLGVKPLYYAHHDNALWFASEAKALLPIVGVETCELGLRDYLEFQWCLPGHTMFKRVRQLEAGHTMEACWPSRAYWRPRLDPQPGPHVGRIRNVLKESVALHTRADVPVASYLSGGLDSSTVAALAKAPCYGGGFKAPGYNELPWAELLARHHGLPLTEVLITPGQVRQTLERLMWHLDFPVAGPGAIPQYIVAGAVREKVVLGGQGGDELFGGYPRYRLPWPQYVAYMRRTPELGGLVRLAPTTYSPVAALCARLTHRGALPQRLGHLELQTQLQALLHVEDRVSMAHGLESRVPLLDHRLVEAALQAPAYDEPKRLLRRAATPYLPKPVRERTDKMGFPVPLNQWLAGPLREWVSDVLTCQAARERELVDNGRVLGLLDTEGRYSRQLWGLLCLELWHQTYHDRASHLTRGTHAGTDHRRGGLHWVAPDRAAAV